MTTNHSPEPAAAGPSLAQLAPHPRNPNLMSDETKLALAKSLSTFGDLSGIILNRRTGQLVGGHQRVDAMQRILQGGTVEVERRFEPPTPTGSVAEGAVVCGGERYRYREVDWDEQTASAAMIAANQFGRAGEWDQQLLTELLEELHQKGLDMALTGFDLDQLQAWAIGQPAGTEGQCDPDDVPAPPDEAKTKHGDLWILGRHRLLCGDSASKADVATLLGGARIHLVNSDPPYNVNVEPRSNNAIVSGQSGAWGVDWQSRLHHQGFDVARGVAKMGATHDKLRPKDRPLRNDFVSPEEFDRMLDAWFGNMAAALEPGRGFYIWGGYANLGNYPRALREAGLYYSQGVVWDKQHPVLTRKDFMGAFELAFYGWREGAAHQYYGPNNATDLWHVKKVCPQKMIHLTEKPVELATTAIQYSSKPGENVLDLFGGSGSTLIACEMTGRVAYLMELDELYCDVIVQRWENFTGKQAVLAPVAGPLELPPAAMPAPTPPLGPAPGPVEG